ncbi:MAG: CvpA family protein [Candidatus Binatia bacterium]
MNWIDLALLVVLLLFGLRGYFRGLFREVFSLLGLVAGLIGASRYAELLSGFVATYWDAPSLVLKGTSFVICFFVIYVFFNLIGWLLHRSAKALFLQTVNRFGGILLGVGKGAALAAFVVFAVTSTALIPSSARQQLDQAYLVSPLANLADALIRFGKTKIFIKPAQARSAVPLRSA